MIQKRGDTQRVLVVNQYYAPDVASTGQYATDICIGLSKKGHEVHVVTAQPSYTASSPEAPGYELMNGVHVWRVSLGKNRGREKLKVRIFGYLRFLRAARRKGEELVKSRKYQAVVTFHNPPLVGLIGAYLEKKYGLRFIYIPYDIHPDILLATGWKVLSPMVWIWELVNRRIFRQANYVVALGEGIKDTLVNHKNVAPEKVRVIPLWGKPEFDSLPECGGILKDLGVNDKELLFLYAGNMGTLHNLDFILDAALLTQELPVRFFFLGDGVKKQSLVSRVKDEKIHRVTVLPYQPWDKFVRILACSHACFVVLGSGLEKLAVPSRAYTFLSAGKPLITIMSPEADIARLVEETGCGWNVVHGEELAELIRRLVDNPKELAERGKIAREVYAERYRKERIIQMYAELLEGD